MTDLSFILRDRPTVDRMYEYARSLPSNPIMEVVFRPFEKNRTSPQNSRYWASLTEYLKEITHTIKRISEETGYTPFEVKRLVAKEMPAEYVAILFAKTPEVAHEVIKEICNVPTSTRLGTKKFMEFEETMEQTIAEIAGYVKAFNGAR